ncbi:MAG: glycosyltransferase family A protein [Bacilli bacterium]|nr:glycosyltransferase family A protein [Bacilli bacterium]MDD4808765.1 glycosyltransferase family A protein [Bacilli bacterium]
MFNIEKHEIPLVSIITPCYNMANYISRYLNSIIKQTYKNIEIIIVDDGSNDNLIDIINKYEDKLNKENIKLKYFYKDNGGLGSAINVGLKNMEGDYFCWCDADNFYVPTYVEENIKMFISNPNYGIIRCDGYIVNENDINKIVARMSYGNKDKFNEKLFMNAILEKNFHFGCAMVKTSLFDKCVKDRNIYPSREGQNYQILLPMFYYYKSGYIDQPLFYFVRRSNSISNITNYQNINLKIKQINEYEKIIKEVLKTLPVEKKIIKLVEQKYSRRKMLVAYQEKNKKILQQEFSKLKKHNCINYKDYILYYRGSYQMLDILLKIILLPKRIISR